MLIAPRSMLLLLSMMIWRWTDDWKGYRDDGLLIVTLLLQFTYVMRPSTLSFKGWEVNYTHLFNLGT